MCGIVAALGLTSDPASNRSTVIKASTLLRHRGPDASGVYQSPNGSVILSHERLSIIDPSESGLQPMRIQRAQGDLVWIVNGEIYNHEKLRQFELSEEALTWTSSDSAVVGHLFENECPFSQKKNDLAMVLGIDGVVIGYPCSFLKEYLLEYDRWVDQLRDHADRVVADGMWNKRAKLFPEDIPLTKEYFLLQSLFEELFPKKEALKTVPKGLTLSKTTREGLDFEPSWKAFHELSKKALDFHSIVGSCKVLSCPL